MKIDEEILSQIKELKNIAIYTHNLVDADSIGSAVALRLALEKLGKKADIFCEDKIIPKKYLFLPYAKEVNKPVLKEYDLAIAVDVAAVQKLGREVSIQFRKFEKSIKIDHHLSSEDFAKLNFVDSKVSSCAMIIYYLLPLLGVKDIDKDIATALYAGISGDTGCFRNANTTALDHEVTAKLMEKGIDTHDIDRWLFKYTSMNELALKRRVIGRFKKYADGKVCMVYATLKDFQETNTTIADTTSIIYMVDAVDDCELAVMLCEHREGIYKISFRSVLTDAALKVAKAFGGGGHPQSSGCQIFGSLNTVITKIVKASEVALDGQK